MNKRLCLLTLTAMISACSADLDDLIEYSNQVRANTQVNIEKYPEFKAMPSVQYEADGVRSPFTRVRSRQETEEIARRENCEQPNSNRKKQPLEAFGVDAMQMAGVFTTNGKRFALVKTNDGGLHRVSVGNYIGLFHGQVVNISNSEVKIREMLPDGTGCWKTKEASLSMSTVTGDDNNV